MAKGQEASSSAYINPPRPLAGGQPRCRKLHLHLAAEYKPQATPTRCTSPSSRSRRRRADKQQPLTSTSKQLAAGDEKTTPADVVLRRDVSMHPRCDEYLHKTLFFSPSSSGSSIIYTMAGAPSYTLMIYTMVDAHGNASQIA